MCFVGIGCGYLRFSFVVYVFYFKGIEVVRWIRDEERGGKVKFVIIGKINFNYFKFVLVIFLVLNIKWVFYGFFDVF